MDLDPRTPDRVRAAWAEKLDVAFDVLATPGLHRVKRPDADAVVVLDLPPAVVVIGPKQALRDLADEGRDQLADPPVLVSRLARHRPRPKGVADLAYVDRAPQTGGPGAPRVLRVGDGGDGGDGGVGDDAVAALRARCAPADVAESGLDGLADRFVALGPDGTPGAVAGFARWRGGLAQLGVLVDPGLRRRGLGRAAAAVAVGAALDAGLVAQWRSRVGHEASHRLGVRLGFVRLGRETVVLLGH